MAARSNNLTLHLSPPQCLTPLATTGLRVPVELVREIFSIACAPDLASMLSINGPSHPGGLDALHISHVCRWWRVVALETAVLWTQVSFKSVEMAEMFVARAQELPLWVDFRNPSVTSAIDSDFSGRRCFDLLHACLARAVHLGIVISIDDPVDYRCRLFESLENFGNATAGSSTSNLRSLNIRQDTEIPSDGREACHSSFPHCLRALTPFLAHLTLSLPMSNFVFARPEERRSVASLPPLRDGTPSVFIQLINGDALAVVEVKKPDAQLATQATTIPTLQLFARSDLSFHLETLFLPFLKPATIENLHLTQSRGDNSVSRRKLRMRALINLLAQLPRLRHLSFTVLDLSVAISSLYILGKNKVQLETLSIETMGGQRFDNTSGCARELSAELTGLLQSGVKIQRLRINAFTFEPRLLSSGELFPSLIQLESPSHSSC